MKEEQFATLDDTILYIWKNAKHLNLNDINRMIQELKEVLEKDENKEGKMSYFKVNCPFCEGNSVSDVIDSIEEVDGQWECSNGHQFVVKYLGKIE